MSQDNSYAFFSPATFYQLFLAGYVVDGRAGGLVVGRSHEQGNIYAVSEFKDGFAVRHNLEGFEYIVNHEASLMFSSRLNCINSGEAPKEIENYIISPTSRILNTGATPHDKFLFIDHRGQFIVNRISTLRNLVELERMNASVSPFAEFNLDWLNPK